jgi:hypothetical protein
VSPKRLSGPLSLLTESLSAPPLRVSFPPLPIIESLPAPPLTLSLPTAASLSTPSTPESRSAPLLPESLLFEPQKLRDVKAEEPG